MNDFAKDDRSMGLCDIEAAVNENDGSGYLKLDVDGEEVTIHMTADDRRWLLNALYYVGDDDYYEEQIVAACRQIAEEKTVGHASATIVWKDGINPFEKEN